MNVVQRFVRDYPQWVSGTVQDLAEEEGFSRRDYMIILDALWLAQGYCRDRRRGRESGIAVDTDEYALRWQDLQKLTRKLYREVEAADKGEG